MHDTEQFEEIPFGVVNDYTNLFHTAENDAILTRLLEEAEVQHVPVVTPNVAYLLQMLVTIHQPGCILELGTAFGVSAYHMLRGLQTAGKLVTIDLVAERQQIAENFLRAEKMDRHQLNFLCEDFREEGYFQKIASLYGPFDFVFIDAAKGQYASILEAINLVTTENAVIVFDNIFLNGWIIADEYPNHRQKTAFLRMKQFLKDIKNDERFIRTLLPLDDGVLILAKK